MIQLRWFAESCKISEDDIKQISEQTGMSLTETKFQLRSKLKPPVLQYKSLSDKSEWKEIPMEYSEIDINTIKELVLNDNRI